MSEACCEARKTTTAATSSGLPKRPRGKSLFTKAAMRSGSACRRRSQELPGKSREPGATLFTRILFGANWHARDLVRLMRAALSELYAVRPPDSRPKTDEIVMMRPSPCWLITGATSLARRASASTFSASASSQSSSLVSKMFWPFAPPALCTRISIRPKCSKVDCTTRSISCATVRSATTASVSVPPLHNTPAVSSSALRPRATIERRHPSAAKAKAIAFPTPRLAPVTIATLPFRPRSIIPPAGSQSLEMRACNVP